jgi:outer membrane protein OmpA-like peptidoglycan-associated protein
MKTYFTVKHVLLVPCLLAMPMLAGCNTTAGLGQDIQQAGSWVEGGARQTEAWVFGSSSAQAAELENSSDGSSAQTMTSALTPTPEAQDNAVFFQTGSAEIPPDGLEMLRSIADRQRQAPEQAQGQDGAANHRIEVIGHSDSAGPAEFNEDLSRRRAEAVADALAAAGLPRDSIDVQWHGENQLPVPTGDGVPEPQNRRVSIAMTGG